MLSIVSWWFVSSPGRFIVATGRGRLLMNRSSLDNDRSWLSAAFTALLFSDSCVFYK